MPNETLQETLARLEEKIDAVYISAEKTRKYFLWTVIATIAMFVLPLLAAGFILPYALSTFQSIYPM